MHYAFERGLYGKVRRPLDWLYIVFFAIHFLASILVDGQYFYPRSVVPASLSQIKADYIRDSADPLLPRLGKPDAAWFTAAVVLELVLQCPTFLVGIWCLFRNDRRVYPLLAAYATLGSSSTLFCLVQALHGPASAALTAANRQSLAGAYGPFLAVPSVLMVDMIARSTTIIANTVSNEIDTAHKTK
ncbi:hypothetical protein BCV69DRAFT_252913 [Microstroma glucosiphilum]|uniref:Efficient mitochondria targeting-associated protein 19 n=1 Tax=Pseudomicrostroma glucosiphilum TaxID=1684307 RepID=A0A316TYG8_9BASI|nr:hypothetical protein BCV69DRAFT_252913 [Pseudomicrostroma glucosiphilum]PWN18272.1 hypothetical protein BCV69DRAFT_252913 [Pseudomicrostroma glucosiphilum]